MATPTSKRTVVAIPPDLHRRIKTLSARKGNTIEHQVRVALERYLRREERRLSRVRT